MSRQSMSAQSACIEGVSHSWISTKSIHQPHRKPHTNSEWHTWTSTPNGKSRTFHNGEKWGQPRIYGVLMHLWLSPRSIGDWRIGKEVERKGRKVVLKLNAHLTSPWPEAWGRTSGYSYLQNARSFSKFRVCAFIYYKQLLLGKSAVNMTNCGAYRWW